MRPTKQAGVEDAIIALVSGCASPEGPTMTTSIIIMCWYLYLGIFHGEIFVYGSVYVEYGSIVVVGEPNIASKKVHRKKKRERVCVAYIKISMMKVGRSGEMEKEIYEEINIMMMLYKFCILNTHILSVFSALLSY